MAKDLHDQWINKGDFIITTDHWKGSGLSYGIVLKTSHGQVEVLSYGTSYMRQIRKTDKYIMVVPQKQIPENHQWIIGRNLRSLCERQRDNPNYYRRYGLLINWEDFNVQFSGLNLDEAPVL